MAIKLKFSVDVGKKVEQWLAENGKEGRMVITMDKDFGELVYNSGKLHSGVLILRLEDANGGKKVETVKKILCEYSDKLYGKFCVFQGERLRVKS
ncbi:MAG: DUF5615 family PIN-like protein [Deltaproteobacteria bacterium]|nr:DUF5615 family PIN-like protein [Deltaproteobacteria bacterium]